MTRSTRVLLIGASGQLGAALTASFADQALTLASNAHARAGHVRLDLGNAENTLAVLRETRPELVLIAGAMCHVDLCEQEPDACRRINTAGPAAVADYARDHGATAVFFSTDHVFDGRREHYVETDAVNPLNEYSRSKGLAEAALRERLPDRHLILRTSWVYGPDPQRRNFVLRLVDRLRAGETVAVPSDQWGSPTYTEDLAAVTRFLVDRGHRGTFHATGPDFVARASLAAAICEEFGIDAGGLLPRSTAELKQAAPRPPRVRLDGRKLRDLGSPPFRTVREGLRSLSSALVS